MKPAASRAVTRNSKTTHYMLYTGFAYDTRENRKDESHAASGLAELFVLEKTGDTWRIAQHGKSEIGAWGSPPQEWRFVQVGAQNWGYQAESGFTKRRRNRNGAVFHLHRQQPRRRQLHPQQQRQQRHVWRLQRLHRRRKTPLPRQPSESRRQNRLQPQRRAKRRVEHPSHAQRARPQKRYAKQPYAMPYNSRQHSHAVPKTIRFTLRPNARHLV